MRPLMLILVMACLLMLGCHSNTMPAQPSSQPPLRAMAFNIRFATANDGPNHWDVRQDAVIAAVKAFDPDILGTQETLLVQRDFITARLPHLKAIGVGRDDGKAAGEMTVTFFRADRFELLASGHFWLSETPEIPGSKGWDTAITRMATWLKLRDRSAPGAKSILVINTHFDHVGKTARHESARLLRARAAQLGKGSSVIIMGDFNCTEVDPPYAELAGQPVHDRLFIDTYRRVHPTPAADEATFTAFKPDATAGKRIDFIFATDDFAVEQASIDRTLRDGRLPSDHFPVTATLRR